MLVFIQLRNRKEGGFYPEKILVHFPENTPSEQYDEILDKKYKDYAICNVIRKREVTAYFTGVHNNVEYFNGYPIVDNHIPNEHLYTGWFAP